LHAGLEAKLLPRPFADGSGDKQLIQIMALFFLTLVEEILLRLWLPFLLYQ